MQDKFYFLQIVASVQNMLSGVVAGTDMIVASKKLLDRRMDMQGMAEYESCASKGN